MFVQVLKAHGKFFQTFQKIISQIQNIFQVVPNAYSNVNPNEGILLKSLKLSFINLFSLNYHESYIELIYLNINFIELLV